MSNVQHSQNIIKTNLAKNFIQIPKHNNTIPWNCVWQLIISQQGLQPTEASSKHL